MPFKKTTFICLFLFAASAMAGCDSSTEAQDAQPASALKVRAYDGNSNVYRSQIKNWRNLSEVEREELRQELNAVHNEILLFLKNKPDWQEAHESAQALLEQPAPSVRASIQEQVAAQTEQRVASAMLKQRLLTGGTPTPERQEAIAFYTDLLIEHDNPQGPLLASALAHLEGYWSEERMARAAEHALEVTREQLASEEKEASESQKLIAKVTGADTPGTYYEEQLRQLREATSQLEALAK